MQRIRQRKGQSERQRQGQKEKGGGGDDKNISMNYKFWLKNKEVRSLRIYFWVPQKKIRVWDDIIQYDNTLTNEELNSSSSLNGLVGVADRLCWERDNKLYHRDDWKKAV